METLVSELSLSRHHPPLTKDYMYWVSSWTPGWTKIGRTCENDFKKIQKPQACC